MGSAINNIKEEKSKAKFKVLYHLKHVFFMQISVDKFIPSYFMKQTKLLHVLRSVLVVCYLKYALHVNICDLLYHSSNSYDFTQKHFLTERLIHCARCL